jgi:hypothetical protein
MTSENQKVANQAAPDDYQVIEAFAHVAGVCLGRAWLPSESIFFATAAKWSSARIWPQ